MGSVGICPVCGGDLENDITSGEYGWVCCDTCTYRRNIFTGVEEYLYLRSGEDEQDNKGGDNDQNC